MTTTITTAAPTIPSTDRPFATTVLTADHGIVDSRGRAVGGVARIQDLTALRAKRIAEGVGASCPDCFSLRVAPTRAGAEFGASPNSTYHPTLEAALAEATRKLEAQGKSYAKKAASGKL